MKYLFVIQSDGCGHFTTALQVKELLERNGHEVSEVMVGTNRFNTIPPFFLKKINIPVITFPNQGVYLDNKKKYANKIRTCFAFIKLFLIQYIFSRKWVVHLLFNLFKLPGKWQCNSLYIQSIVEKSEADCILNFHEQAFDLAYYFLHIKKPLICIANHYIFLLPNALSPIIKSKSKQLELKVPTILTCLKAQKCIAISLIPMKGNERIEVVPPILREEVLSKKKNVSTENFILIYLLNPGYVKDVLLAHSKHPEIPLHVFINKSTSSNLNDDETLKFHTLNDDLFLELLCRCKAVISNSGFTLISEAMYLGKPIEMIPTHGEQEYNALQMEQLKGGIISKTIDLDALLLFAEHYRPSKNFQEWVDSAKFPSCICY